VTRLARRLLRGGGLRLLVANLATLWIVRDGYVNGWDFFGATYGVLALNAGSFAQGVHTILQSVSLRKGGGRVDAPGRGLVEAKGNDRLL